MSEISILRDDFDGGALARREIICSIDGVEKGILVEPGEKLEFDIHAGSHELSFEGNHDGIGVLRIQLYEKTRKFYIAENEMKSYRIGLTGGAFFKRSEIKIISLDGQEDKDYQNEKYDRGINYSIILLFCGVLLLALGSTAQGLVFLGLGTLGLIATLLNGMNAAKK